MIATSKKPVSKLGKREAEKLGKLIGFKEVFVFIGAGLYAAVCKVTPVLAQSILDTRNGKNRKPKEKAINRYARDMIHSRWRLTHEGIAFTVDGNLGDGQNRLYAIVASGQPIDLLVFLGLDPESPKVIDEGAVRSAKDAADFWGIDVTKKQLAACKNAANGFGHLSDSLSNPEQLDLLEKFSEGLAFLNSHVKMVRGVTSNAAVLGAVLRAYYYYRDNPVTLARFKKFVNILIDGQYNGVMADTAPYRLREKLLGKEKFFGQPRFVYGISENAIIKFMERKSVKNLTVPKTEQFPLVGLEIHEDSAEDAETAEAAMV